MSYTGWVGVDLDRSLAHYDKFRGPHHIGEPVPAMLERVKKMLTEGQDVRIFTARVWYDPTDRRSYVEAQQAREEIERWCEKHIGRVLPITNYKDYAMTCLYDDRAYHVVPNTGAVLGEELEPLSSEDQTDVDEAVADTCADCADLGMPLTAAEFEIVHHAFTVLAQIAKRRQGLDT